MIGMGRRIGNLYVLSTSSLPLKVFNVSLTNVSFTQSELWHYRIGHPSFPRLSVIRNALQICEIKHGELFDCSIWHMSKQRLLPFQSNNLIDENAFDLVHIDIWGPFNSITVEGYRYFLTIVDTSSQLYMTIPGLLGCIC